MLLIVLAEPTIIQLALRLNPIQLNTEKQQQKPYGGKSNTKAIQLVDTEFLAPQSVRESFVIFPPE